MTVIEPIECQTGNARLVGGTEEYEGRVEVCINNNWGSVCRYSWSNNENKVLCKQLGHQELGKSKFSILCPPFKISEYVFNAGNYLFNLISRRLTVFW